MRNAKGVGVAVIVVAVVGLVIAAAMYFIFNNLQSKTSLIVGDGAYEATVAKDDKSRQKGLGGVTQMKENDALLMIFPSDGKWGIWMKDMKVPIDIVWLDKDKKVIYIVKSASPDIGISTSFVPKSDARYVIELPAGSANQKGIGIGDTALFAVEEGDVK